MSEDIYQNFGNIVRMKRRQLALTQKLAELTDMSLSFLGHIERGSRKCSIKTMQKLCKILNIDGNDALCLNISKHGESQFRNIIEQLQALISDLQTTINQPFI